MKLTNEEEVKIHHTIPWLESLGYDRDCMSFETSITVQEGRKERTIYADIVVYSSPQRETPLVVVDTKGPLEVLGRTDVEQVISYARLLPTIAPLAVLTNSRAIQVFQTLDKSRLRNLPPRADLTRDFISAVLSEAIRSALQAEARSQLFAIEDVATFKNLLKKCHNEIRNNEGYDPVQAFDELSKVLFAKMYEEQRRGSGDTNRFTLTTYDESLRRLGVNIVQQQFSEIQKIPEYSDLFPEGTRIELNDRTIRAIVSLFENYDLTLTRFDVKGEAFEYFLSDTFTGGLGEYFTPRNVVEFMVDAVSPRIGDKIVDPFCGTGGFLIYAFDVVSEKIRLQDFSDDERAKWRLQLSNASLFGTDWKERTSQACKMNMIVHGDGNTGIFKHNGLSDVDGRIEADSFDICFTNPPFGAIENDESILAQYEMGRGRKTQKREILALERCIRLVKPGGTIAIVLPDGLLNNDRYSNVREYLHRNVRLISVIGLNRETFEGYNSRVKTSILILQKRNKVAQSSQDVFMAVCRNSGYGPTGVEIAGNELPDILFDYKAFMAGQMGSALHNYFRIVKITDAQARIDSEYFVKIQNDSEIPIATISQSVASLAKGLGGQEEFISDFAKLRFDPGEFERKRLGDLLIQVKAREKVVPGDDYRLLGVRWWGKGVFEKELKKGNAIKAATLFRVRPGLLVYNRLFAWKGSFAVIDEEFSDGFVSGEFPLFDLVEERKDRNEVIRYLAFYLCTPSVLRLVERASTGSTKTSRARLREKVFMNIEVPMPKESRVLRRITDRVRGLGVLEGEAARLQDKMGELQRSFGAIFPSAE